MRPCGGGVEDGLCPLLGVWGNPQGCWPLLVLRPLKRVALSVDIANVLFHGVDGDVQSNADRLIGAADLAQQPPAPVAALMARHPLQLQYARADLTGMVDAGRSGAINNLASQAGRRGEALVSHYCASKAAVISYAQSGALAMAPHGMRVNAIAPGVVDTPMWAQVDALFARYEGLQPGAKKRAVGLAVPLGRMGLPADLTGAAVFLASDEARYITAQTLNVDGGSVMRQARVLKTGQRRRNVRDGRRLGKEVAHQLAPGLEIGAFPKRDVMVV